MEVRFWEIAMGRQQLDPDEAFEWMMWWQSMVGAELRNLRRGPGNADSPPGDLPALRPLVQSSSDGRRHDALSRRVPTSSESFHAALRAGQLAHRTPLARLEPTRVLRANRNGRSACPPGGLVRLSFGQGAARLFGTDPRRLDHTTPLRLRSFHQVQYECERESQQRTGQSPGIFRSRHRVLVAKHLDKLCLRPLLLPPEDL
jgi:hypothetical protein